MKRSILTIATAKRAYVKMAFTLARSFLRWNADSDITFFLVTDQNLQLPKDLDAVKIIQIEPGALGTGFSPKLHLDQLAQTDATLFIDADCLCFGELTSVFDRFRGRAVSVVGGSISNGEWFGDVGSVCAHFGLPSIPKFNGGIYYLERGAKASAVYQRARELEKDYDDLGLVRLRHSPNDELLMAIAMALEGCTAVPDDGTILGDLMARPNLDEIDVLRGVGRISNPPRGDAAHRDWAPVGEIRPLLVHFLGDFTSHYFYRCAEMGLVLTRNYGIPAPAARRTLSALYQTPALMMQEAKAALRPLYHRLFGPRRVPKSERI